MIRLNLAIFQRIYKTENEVKASVNVHGHAINSLTTSQDLTLRRERERVNGHPQISTFFKIGT